MRKIILITLITLLPLNALAWNAFGHRLVTTIAYDHLRPDVKRQVNLLTDAMNGVAHRTNFIVASTWPDQIKYHDVHAYDDWHFVDKSFSDDGSQLTPISPQNIVWAIQQSLLTIKSHKSTRFEKAMFLRFLTHFVGDIHQPLHCIEYFSHRFPSGDQGGNLYLIKSKYAHNLHQYWDNGLGMFGGYMPQHLAKRKRRRLSNLRKAKIRNMATQIEQQFPESKFTKQLLNMQPGIWANESFYIGKDFAYSMGVDQHPNKNYLQKGREIAKRQIALAGYRLAKLLNSTFSKSGPY